MIDDEVVKAKAEAAEEMSVASGMIYVMYAGSVLMKQNVLLMQLESMLIVFIIWSAKRKFILYHVKVNTVSLTKVRAAK